MGRSKATPICPYVFHLYHSHELLLPAKKEYRIKEALLKHNVESEGKEDPESPEDPDEEESSDYSECESLTSREIREIQKQDAAKLKKSPLNKRKQPLVAKMGNFIKVAICCMPFVRLWTWKVRRDVLHIWRGMVLICRQWT